jgi:hypothetical protein
MDPLTPARALVSVMLADGDLRAGEQQFVEAWLRREGHPPPTVRDLRVWRPNDLGPPPPGPLAERLLEGCIQLAYLDREPDGSERRLIAAYARAWGVPEAWVAATEQSMDRRYGTVLTRLWRRLAELVRVR